jgi:signal transduction histidine kinase
MMRALVHTFWPKSLYAQILLAAALALFVAQTFNAVMLLSAERNRAYAEAATMLLARTNNHAERQMDRGLPVSTLNKPGKRKRPPVIALLATDQPLMIAGFAANTGGEGRANDVLAQSETGLSDARFSSGPLKHLPEALSRGLLQKSAIQRMRMHGRGFPDQAMLLSVKAPDGKWLNAATYVRPRDGRALIALLLQTLTLYIAVLIPLALIARRIARPLKSLTGQAQYIGLAADVAPIVSEGPGDVRALIDAFNAMQARVQALLGEKDVMLGAIGHDLKTPLASLRVRIENVEDDQERDKMAATVDEMVTILNDILTLARLGKSGEALIRTDMGALVESLLEEFDNQSVHLQLPDTKIVANIRPVLIRRALRNLITNAIQYGSKADISIRQDDTYMCIMIDDNGPGISDDAMPNIFEPFARSESSRSRKTGGSGLGLTIARAVARGHNGDVTLANRPDGGLRAELALPL